MGQLAVGLVGAAAGFAIGGPTGAQLGWLLASTAYGLMDQSKASGPRMMDTKAKGADYGKMRPIVFGTMRVSGIGCFQTDYVEHEEGGGGKGASEPASYRYTASWGNELCEGPVEGVLRRWCNNKLWTEQGAASNDQWPFTLYLGGTTQLPDPTIEAEYGAGEVSPMRGIAYEVVTDKDVADFLNAIPEVEYEVHTTPVTDNLRIVKSNYATGAWAVSPNNYPILIDWPANGNVVVSAPSLATEWLDELLGGLTFSTSDLAVNGTATSSDSGLYRFPIGEGAPSGGWYGIGMYQWTDHQQALWRSNAGLNVGTSAPITDSSLDNFLQIAGVPDALFMSACCMSQDGYTLWVFTNPTSAYSDDSTHWYKIVEGVVVDDGTCSPAFERHAFGVQCAVSDQFGQMTAENSGEYFWVMNEDQNTVEVYRITAGNFAFTGMTLQVPWTAQHVLNRSTIKALATPGYAGAFFGDSMVLMSRLGPPEKVVLGDIVAALLERGGLTSAQYDVSDLTQLVRGFGIFSQMTIGNAIDILRQGYFFDATTFDGKVVYRNRGHDADVTIPDEDLAAHVPGTEKPEPLETYRVPESELPRTVFINYYDEDHDYQPGSQYWRNHVTLSQSDVTLDLPIVMTATEALHRAQWHQHFAFLERDRFTFYLGPKWARLTPTDVVVVRGVNIRITARNEAPSGVIKFEGVRAFAGPYTSPITDPGSGDADDGELPGDGGDGQPPQDPPGAKADTAVILIDGPLTSEADSATGLRAAIYKDSGGAWPGATLMKSVDGGTTYASVASTTTSAGVGTVAAALGTFTGGNVIDRSNVLRVFMQNGGTLSSTTEAGLQNGVNLIALGSAAAGWELLQFQTATLVATDTYDLTGLLRGRFGTEWAMATHAASEILVVWASTIAVPGSLAEVGLSRKYKGVTNGTAVADATAQDFTNTGVALKAWAPVLLGHGVNGSGDVILTCVPRRRGSGGWPDGVDLPATDPANWQWEIATDAGFTNVVRAIGTTVTEATYTAAMQTTDLGSPGTPFYWRVAQFSALGLGYFAEATA